MVDWKFSRRYILIRKKLEKNDTPSVSLRQMFIKKKLFHKTVSFVFSIKSGELQ